MNRTAGVVRAWASCFDRVPGGSERPVEDEYTTALTIEYLKERKTCDYWKYSWSWHHRDRSTLC